MPWERLNMWTRHASQRTVLDTMYPWFYILPPVQNCWSCYGSQTCKVRHNPWNQTSIGSQIARRSLLIAFRRDTLHHCFHLLFLHPNIWMLHYCKRFYLLTLIYTWAWYGKKVRCMYSSQNSALFAIKCCMIDAVLQFWAMTDGNATLRKIKNWHGRKKQPRMSRLLQRQNVSRCLKAGWVYVIWNLHQDPGSLTETKIFHYWEIYLITDELLWAISSLWNSPVRLLTNCMLLNHFNYVELDLWC